jgi:D-alanyl-lipoteichoic acid acyltransferase DltB (MBOAT superfamily)
MYSWHLPANFLVLRILSFGLDMHRSVTITDDADAKKHDDAPPSDSVVSQENHAHVATTTQSRPLDDYNLLNFISYTLYAPLYMAGPIITFDSFMQCTVSPEVGKPSSFFILPVIAFTKITSHNNALVHSIFHIPHSSTSTFRSRKVSWSMPSGGGIASLCWSS